MEDNKIIVWFAFLGVAGIIAYYSSQVGLELLKNRQKPLPTEQRPSPVNPSPPVTPSPPIEKKEVQAPKNWLKLCEKYKSPSSACWWLQEKFAGADPERMTWDKKVWNGGRYKGWEAHFFYEGHEYEVEFDERGNWLETELQKVPEAMIPTIVKEAIKRDFPKETVLHWEIEQTTDGKVFYEAEIHLENDIDITYDSEGKQYKNNIYED